MNNTNRQAGRGGDSTAVTGEAPAGLRQLWQWFSLVDFRYPDAMTLARARLILRACRIIIPVALITLLVTLARLGTPTDPLLRALTILATLIVSGADLLVIRWIQRGKQQQAELLFTLSITITSIAVFFVHGLNDPYLLVLLIPILISSFLYGRFGLSQSAAVILLILVVRSVLDSALAPHLLAFTQTVNVPVYNLLAGLILFITLSVILWAFLALGGNTTLPAATTRQWDTLVSLVIATVARYRSFQEVFEQAAEDLRVQLGYYYIQLFVFDQPSGLLVRAGQRGTLNPALRDERRIALEDPHSIIADTARDGQPRLITEVAGAADRAEFLAGTHAELLIPVVQEGALIGVLDVHSTQTGAFAAGEIGRLQAIGGLIGFALTRLRQSDEALASRTEREALRDQVYQLREQLGSLQRETVRRDWNQFLGDQPNRELSFIWDGQQVMAAPEASGRTALPNSVSDPDPSRALTAPQIRMENGQQALIVPIVVRGQSLGGMVFYPADGIQWDDRSLDTASAIGQRLTLMVENLRLIEESRTAVLREQLINEVTTRLQTQTSLDELLNTAADVFSQSLGASSARIRIVPAETAQPMTTVTGPLSPRSLPPQVVTSPSLPQSIPQPNGENSP